MRSLAYLRLIPFVISLLLFPYSSSAEHQWEDSFNESWPTGESACSEGEAARRLLQKEAEQPGLQWRINSYSFNYIDGQEGMCRFTIERQFIGMWLPDSHHLYSIYNVGQADLCPSGILDLSGQCCAECPTTECNASNPILGATGQKVQIETDLHIPGSNLSFSRNYWSSRNQDGPLGLGWTHNWNRRLVKLDNNRIKAYRADGRALLFTYSGGQWQAAAAERLTLNSSGSGWVLQAADASLETYDALGRLQLYQATSGPQLHFQHDQQGRVQQITDSGGRQLLLSYDNGRLAQLAFDTLEITYQYDSQGRLAGVNQEGMTRHYHYEHAIPHLLTGITDERGARYATWSYDTEGRALSSEHAGNHQVSFDYLDADRVRVTNPLGKQAIYHYQTVGQRRLITRVDGEASAYCAAASREVHYDAQGLVLSRTNWSGNVTTYSYNARGLEISRTEAAGTPEARTITTEWHPALPQPVMISEPGRIIEMSYDAQGRLLSRAERPQLP